MRAWRDFEEHITVEKRICSPIQSKIGPVFKDKSKFITDYLESLEEIPQEFPIVITNDDGEYIIESDMVEIKNTKIIQRGEWFTPHVIEPAFGIDRIIWHILEHSHKEISKKDDENYTVLSLNSDVVPIDFSLYPLFAA